jgi:hypothetical protein
MSFKSVLDKIGADAVEVLKWLGSPTGQSLVKTGEAVVESQVPAAAGLINLANTWFAEIIKTQTIATAAGAGTGSSLQKSAAVIAAVTPQALQFAQSQGVPLTTAQLQAANDALVAFANAFANPAATPAV